MLYLKKLKCLKVNAVLAMAAPKQNHDYDTQAEGQRDSAVLAFTPSSGHFSHFGMLNVSKSCFLHLQICSLPLYLTE